MKAQIPRKRSSVKQKKETNEAEEDVDDVILDQRILQLVERTKVEKMKLQIRAFEKIDPNSLRYKSDSKAVKIAKKARPTSAPHARAKGAKVRARPWSARAGQQSQAQGAPERSARALLFKNELEEASHQYSLDQAAEGSKTENSKHNRKFDVLESPAPSKASSSKGSKSLVEGHSFDEKAMTPNGTSPPRSRAISKQISIQNSNDDGLSNAPLNIKVSSPNEGQSKVVKSPEQRTVTRPISAPILSKRSGKPNAKPAPFQRASSLGQVSSMNYIKQKNLKEEAEAHAFSALVRDEKRLHEEKCTLFVNQANHWCRSLGIEKKFTLKKKQDVFEGSKLFIYVSESGGETEYTCSTEMFLRTHQNLKTAIDRRKRQDSRFSSGTSSALGTPRYNGSNSPTPHSPMLVETKRRSSSNLAKEAYARETDDIVADLKKTIGHGKGIEMLRYRKLSREEVQNKLKQIIKATIERTNLLEVQLNELKDRGWNEDLVDMYIQSLPSYMSTYSSASSFLKKHGKNNFGLMTSS